MVIRPVSRRFGHARIASIRPGSSSGAAPALVPSGDSFTSIITSRGFPASLQTPGEFFGIDRFDHLEQLRRLARFVGLKMADQVELGLGQAAQRGMLFRELLDVVFAEHAQAAGVSLADHRGGEFLGNGDQRDLVARSTAGRRTAVWMRSSTCSMRSRRVIWFLPQAIPASTRRLRAALRGPRHRRFARRAAAGISLIASASLVHRAEGIARAVNKECGRRAV